MAKKKRFKKCDFVVDQNNKVGQIRSVKKQKSFDFIDVEFTSGRRGVPSDFLKKTKPTAEDRKIIKESFVCKK